MTEHTGSPDHGHLSLEGIPGMAFFEHSGVANMLVASDTTLLAVNTRFVEITGYRREEGFEI